MGFPITDIIGGIFSPIKDIVQSVVVDPNKRDQVNLQLAQLEDQAQARLDGLTQGQIDVNKVEASSGSLFVAGWRPAVGWVGAAGLAYSSLVQPLCSWTASVIFHYSGGFPIIDNQLLLYILGGMLGLGGMRTFEKVKGVATNDLSNGDQNPAAPTKTTEVTLASGDTISTKTTPPPSPKSKFHL